MRYKIICDFCAQEHLFDNRFDPPSECSNKACRNSLQGLEIIELETKKTEAKQVINEISSSEKTDAETEADLPVTGLELTYQTNGRKIKIELTEKSILGRTNKGSEVLAGIPQISRAHCAIEFDGNDFHVIDLGSTNGTFIGLGNEKKECKETNKLNDSDFLVLGEEVFLVKLIRKAKEEKEQEIVEDKRILCTECSCVLEKLPGICPDCGAWNEE